MAFAGAGSASLSGGWVGAPVTKVLFFGCVAVSAVLRCNLRPVPIDFGSPLGLLPRLCVLPWCYGSFRELYTGCAMFYAMRVLERFWGSRKFAGYCVVAAVCSTGAHLLLWVVTRSAAVRHIRPGPTSLLFSLALMYWSEVPALGGISVLPSVLSEKSMSYLMLMHNLYDPAAGAASWPQAACGVLGGLLATSVRLPLRRWRPPPGLCQWCSRVLGPLLATDPAVEPPPAAAMALAEGQDMGEQYQEQLLPTFNDLRQGWMPGQRQPGVGGQQQGLRHRGNAAGNAFAGEDGDLQQALQASMAGLGGGGAAAPGVRGGAAAAGTAAPAAAASEENVRRLMDIGVTREQAVAALLRHNDDADAAAASLFQ